MLEPERQFLQGPVALPRTASTGPGPHRPRENGCLGPVGGTPCNTDASGLVYGHCYRPYLTKGIGMSNHFGAAMPKLLGGDRRLDQTDPFGFASPESGGPGAIGAPTTQAAWGTLIDF